MGSLIAWPNGQGPCPVSFHCRAAVLSTLFTGAAYLGYHDPAAAEVAAQAADAAAAGAHHGSSVLDWLFLAALAYLAHRALTRGAEGLVRGTVCMIA